MTTSRDSSLFETCRSLSFLVLAEKTLPILTRMCKEEETWRAANFTGLTSAGVKKVQVSRRAERPAVSVSKGEVKQGLRGGGYRSGKCIGLVGKTGPKKEKSRKI